MKTTINDGTFEFRGKKYLLTSKSWAGEQVEYPNFGDILFDVAVKYGNTELAAFIKTHITVRSTHYIGSADPERNDFLKFLVALGILNPVKVGSQNGYEVVREPRKEELTRARDYALDQHDYGREFYAFKGNDELLKKTARKSDNMLAYLLTTLLKERCNYREKVKYPLSKVKEDMKSLFTEDRINKLLNALTTRGVCEEYFTVEYDEDSVISKDISEIEFNRIQICPSDIEFYTNFTYISNADHVHRTEIKTKDTIKFFDDITDLLNFFKDNITYLMKK